MKEKIPLRKTQIGAVYTTESGNKGLLLGYINTDTMMVDVPNGVKKSFWHERDQKLLMEMDVDFGVRYRRKKFISLWFHLRDPYRGCTFETVKSIEAFFQTEIRKGRTEHFAVKQNYNYSNKSQVGIVEVPTEVILLVRKLANQKALHIMEINQLHRTNGLLSNLRNSQIMAPPDKLRHYDAFLVSPYAALANMVPVGMEPIRSEVCSLFDRWVAKENKYKTE